MEGHRASFTRAGFKRGYIQAQPLAIGVLAYGIMFGLLSSDAGLSLLESLVMSAGVYSGTAQVAAVSGITAGAGIAASVATILLLNARYLLYGAALRPWLGQVPARDAYLSLFFLGDGNWLLSIKANAGGETDAAYVFGSGAAMFAPWMVGTLVGSFAGRWVANPSLLGLDFLLVAFAAAMAMSMYKSRSDWWPIAASFTAAVAADRFAAPGWTIIAAGMAGACVAFARHRPASA